MKLHIGAIILLSAIFLGCTVNSTGMPVKNEDNYVIIPLSEISSNMQKYSFESNGINVNYFAVLGSDGEIRTAFDACDVCGGHKGYKQQGDDVICNNCGRHFDIDEIGTKNVGGGCWPSYLAHEIVDDKLLISKEEIAAGAWRFA